MQNTFLIKSEGMPKTDILILLCEDPRPASTEVT